MKKYLLFTLLTFILLNSNSSATTATFSDTCATLSLAGPDADPDYGYFIDASGKVNSGYSYYAWFYIDGVYTSYSNSFFSTSFTKKYGPFTGPHTYKLTIQGGSSVNLCKRSVELTVASPKKGISVSIGAVTTPTNSNTQTISGSMDSGAIVTVMTDTAASAGTVSYPTPTTWSCTISGLAEGINGITVTAKDAAGNAATATAAISYVVPPKEAAANICDSIKSIQDNAFKNNPPQRKNVLCEKTDEVIELIRDAENSTDPIVQDQFYQEAIEKLRNDIGAKMDGYSGGDSKNDWITGKEAQVPIYRAVQKLMNDLQDLQ